MSSPSKHADPHKWAKIRALKRSLLAEMEDLGGTQSPVDVPVANEEEDDADVEVSEAPETEAVRVSDILGGFDLPGEVHAHFSAREEKDINKEDLQFRRQMSNDELPLHEDEDAAVAFRRLYISSQREVPIEEEMREITKHFVKAMAIRRKYMAASFQDFPADAAEWLEKTPDHATGRLPEAERTSGGVASTHPNYNPFEAEPVEKCSYTFGAVNGVFHVYRDEAEREQSRESTLFPAADVREFFTDMNFLLALITDGPSKSFAFRRLRFLESKFDLHVLLNDMEELHEQKKSVHRDFYNIRKVDTHVHLASCMNQKVLLRFIKRKLKENPDEVVIERGGKLLTLKQVFDSLNLTAHELSVDTLDCHADNTMFHRFDKFNTKYNPIGESRLREVFLKTNNLIKGRYFAEMLQDVFRDIEDTKYQMAEPRVSVYGRSMDEWEKLSGWIVDNKMYSDNVRWLVQVPRLFHIYKKAGQVDNFQDHLNNLFVPLFQATLDPGAHPKIHAFLQQLVGFDSVDDESQSEYRVHKKYPSPAKWTEPRNPPYVYYLFYFHTNLTVLNKLRRERGLRTFVFRPHCGEAGAADHLASAYLTAQGINHGIVLRKVPVLQYLYYLTRIGIAMSPLSNNALFLDMKRNPLPDYLRRGLNVSLSTDDPLQLHLSRDPLVEEYSIAAQVYKLTNTDLCELALNSVRQSGFEDEIKRYWLGVNFKKSGVAGNDISKTNVPNIRVAYRQETYSDELELVTKGSLATSPAVVGGADSPASSASGSSSSN